MSNLTEALRPLPPQALRRHCDPAQLPFETTDALNPKFAPVGQDRAVEAIRFAIGMKAPGYNLFALGPEGTGKLSLVKAFLREAAASQPVPDDWVYVNDFKGNDRPKALRLPSGAGPALQKDMADLIAELRLSLPPAFETEDYQRRLRAIQSEVKKRQDAIFKPIQDEAAERSIAVMRTPTGLALAPMHEGETLSAEDFQQLPEKQRMAFEEDLVELQEKFEEAVKDVPGWEREERDRTDALDKEVARDVVGHLMAGLIDDWHDRPEVVDWLQDLADDVVDNLDHFLDEEKDDEEERRPTSRMVRLHGNPAFRRYLVNALVSQQSDGDGPLGAPVVVEDHPTQPNLVGRIEHLAQYGTMLTDFAMIKAGALHRANGGYLILDAAKLLMQPFAWEDLKRALRSRKVVPEPPGESAGLWQTESLDPEPIPLDVKVVLLGDPMLYYMLAENDSDFHELFKVAADFDYQMPWSPENVMGLTSLLALQVQKDGLRPLHRTAVARIVEQAARLAEDSEKLSTHMATLADLVREADYWAGQEAKAVIEAPHVQRAIEAQDRRHDRVREHVQEEIVRGTVMIATDGEKVGQINGLAVFGLGNFSFGRPSRITARVHAGKGEVIDVEREVDLGGPLHTKGVLIITGFLASRFGAEQPLSLSASLTFEQSYGEVEGDSASSTELYALLSALAEVPIRQGVGVTGSVNQYGEVQAIGGVNEKIEGFFDLCRARGLTGEQGVMIPQANVPHLMLRADVVEACAAGRFHIWPVQNIDQGIEILTGLPAGEPDDKGEFPLGSINRKVAARLAAFNRAAARFAAAMEGRGRRNGD